MPHSASNPPTTRKSCNSNSKGVLATPTRESPRIRVQAQAEAEADVASRANTVNFDRVELSTIIGAAVNDAVNGLVKSPPFVKCLAGLVKEKLFEGAAVEAAKKLAPTKAQMKKVLNDNSTTVNHILTASMQPQLEKVTEVG